MVAMGEDAPKPKATKLFLIRLAEWRMKRPRIFYGDNELGEELPLWWHTDAVFPVGDRTLCWANLYRHSGILFCDLLEESPHLQYMLLPMAPYFF